MPDDVFTMLSLPEVIIEVSEELRVEAQLFIEKDRAQRATTQMDALASTLLALIQYDEWLEKA